MNCDLAVLKNGKVPGSKFADAFPNRAWMGDVLVGEELVDRRRINLGADAIDCGDRFQLAAEHQPVVLDRVIQRFLADPVAGQHQTVTAGVPDGNREHAIQLRKAVSAGVFVQVNDRFTVAMGGELVAAAFQTPAQSLIVVDLAVKDHLNRAIFVAHRLMGTFQVNDAQAAKAECDPDRVSVGVAVIM